MPAHLSVGVETNCTAPLQLERASMRLYQLAVLIRRLRRLPLPDR
jgi:hypothetical protein